MATRKYSINPEYWRLLRREESAFSPSIFDRNDYLTLGAFAPGILESERQQITTYGRSLASDAFYALSGCPINNSDPMSGVWSGAQIDPDFQGLCSQFRQGDASTRAMLVLDMSSRVEARLADLGQQISETADQQGVGVEEAMIMSDAALFADGELAEAGEELEAKEEALAGILWALGGTPPQKFEQAQELLGKYDMKQFAEILGWVKRIVSGATRNSEGGNEVFTRYRTSGINEKILPTQLMGLIQGDLGTLSAAADEALTTRVYSSKAPEGKGPVILLRDESGSMTINDNHRKAQMFEVALAAAFHREGREMISIRWSTSMAAPFVYGEGDLKAHMAGFLNGGTNPKPAMEAALILALEYVQGADLLVLSDAQFPSSYLGDDLLSEFRAEQGRVWAVLFGQDRHEDDSLDEMISWADAWVHSTALEFGGAGMESLLARMATRKPSSGVMKVR